MILNSIPLIKIINGIVSYVLEEKIINKEKIFHIIDKIDYT